MKRVRYGILSEYLWPLAHFQEEKVQDTIVFFGSARLTEEGPLGRYYREARELARLVTEWSEVSKRALTGSSFVRVAAPASWKRPTAAPVTREVRLLD